MAAPKGNLYALGNTGGRPPHFSTPDELNTKIKEYFDHCLNNNENITITGLALFLGFADRQSLFDYEKRDEFSCIIKRARMTVENSYENRLYTHSFGGGIFALKNMGWKDQQEIEQKSSIVDVNNLTDEEKLQYIKLHQKAKNG